MLHPDYFLPGICCDVSGGNSNGTLETFASNSSEACCSACFNNTQCSTWTLTLSNSTDAAPPSHTATSNCTLHSSCAASAGNCTRGEMPPPTPPGPKPPPGGLGYRFVATWRGMHKKESGEGISDGKGSAVSSSSSWNSSASLSNLGNEVGDCTCSLIAPFWIITAEHCAERVLKHEKVDVKINFHGDSPHVRILGLVITHTHTHMHARTHTHIARAHIFSLSHIATLTRHPRAHTHASLNNARAAGGTFDNALRSCQRGGCCNLPAYC